MKKYRRCVACAEPITKSARTNPYKCRDCEREYAKLEMMHQMYIGRISKS